MELFHELWILKLNVEAKKTVLGKYVDTETRWIYESVNTCMYEIRS